MLISGTNWINFRNLKPRRLTWCSGLNLLTGRNGSGKTNTLEALNLACGWGSFNNAETRELHTWDKEKSGNIEISCEASGEESIISEISISSRISARMNSEKVSLSELRTHIPTLCFLPGDMNFIDGTPGIRRVFLDKLCTMLSIPYAKRLSDYKRLVRHRIKLLKTGRSPDITSHLLASIGSWIWSIRSSVIKILSEYAADGLSTLSPYPLEIKLKPGGMENDESSPNILHITKDEFLKRLLFYSEKELKVKIPFVGPHRDDIFISVVGNKGKFSNESSPAGVLSCGQKRRVVVSLMLASGRILESKLKRKPLFLLDEIFSPLDEEARWIVADALCDTGWQIFATSADNTLSLPNRQGKIYYLKDGNII